MSYITLAELRRDTPEALAHARKALNDSRKDAAHRLIWSLFSNDPKAKRDFIFRASKTGRFMIVSDRAPVFDDRVWDLKTKPYAPELKAGDRFGFSLRVNPTLGVSQPDRARSLRVDALMHAKKQNGGKLEPEAREKVALDWLKNKLARNGSHIKPCECQVLDYEQIHLDRKNPKQPATISVIDIDGVLTVEDPARVQSVLLKGIGHGKAFGLGLLLLRPLSE